jgi:hypothetical protein
MGGGGFLGLGPAPSAPAAPDYRGAAQDTAAGNLEAARAATAANRVNQVTPYGNLNYTQSGTDQYGNPTWTATTSLSDVGQSLLNTQNAASLGLGGAINAQLGQVQNVMGQGFNPQTAPITTNIGQANLNPLTGQANLQTQTDYAGGMAGWDRANQLLMQRLQPQMDIQQKTLDAKLANQGVVAGTEAYNRAKMGLGMQQNDLLNQAQLSGLSAGNTLFQQGLAGAQFGNAAQQQGYANQQQQQAANNALQQQMFGNQLTNANLGNAAQQQQFNQALTQYNMPLNTLSALRTGAQVQNPTFVNAPQQATTTGADLLSAAQAQGQYNMGTFNAQQAAQSGANQGLLGLGGTLGAAYMMAPAGSDIRMKENIKAIGWLPNGLPVYEFEYKPEFKDKEFNGHGKFIGVMAQDVEKVIPEAVHTLNDGYKVVDYAKL